MRKSGKMVYFTLTTDYDSFMAPKLLKAVELINSGVIEKSYHELAMDFLKVPNHMVG